MTEFEAEPEVELAPVVDAALGIVVGVEIAPEAVFALVAVAVAVAEAVAVLAAAAVHMLQIPQVFPTCFLQ